jgi:hypothetical protein
MRDAALSGEDIEREKTDQVSSQNNTSPHARKVVG